MFNRLSNVQLIALLIALLIGIVILKVYDKESTDWSFKNQYAPIDSTSVHFVKSHQQPERDTGVIVSNVSDWVKVKYILPQSASFEVVKTDTGWQVNGDVTDSGRTYLFLNSLDTINSYTFVDGLSPYVLVTPEYELDLYKRNGDSIKVQCFVRAKYLFLRSSQNPKNVFDARSDSLFERVYVGKARFFPKQ